MNIEDLKIGDFVHHKDGDGGHVITKHNGYVTVHTTFNKLEDWDCSDIKKKDEPAEVAPVVKQDDEDDVVEPIYERMYVYRDASYLYKCGQKVMCLDRYSPVYLKTGIVTALSNKFVFVFIDGQSYHIDPRDLTLVVEDKDETVKTVDTETKCKCTESKTICFDLSDCYVSDTTDKDVTLKYVNDTNVTCTDCFYTKCKDLLERVYGFAKELEIILDDYENHKNFEETFKNIVGE